MTIDNMAFTPTQGLRDGTFAPTDPGSESALRDVIQDISDQLRDYINNTLLVKLHSETDGSSGADQIGATPITGIGDANTDTVQEILEALKSSIDTVVLGQIPNDSLTDAKLKQTGDNILPNFNAHTADTTKHLGIMTTSGDMIYQGASSPSRLPKGTDGQVLQLSSGLPTWQTLVTSDGAWEKITEVTLGSDLAQVDFTSLSTAYKQFKIIFNGNHIGTTSAKDAKIWFNDDASLSYTHKTAIMAGSQSTWSQGNEYKTNVYYIKLYQAISSNEQVGIMDILISNQASNYRKALLANSYAPCGGINSLTYSLTGGSWDNISSKITKISIAVDTGTFKAGSTFALWGVK